MSNKIEIETLNIGIKNGRNDAVCINIPDDATTALVSTKNKYAAAPVILNKINITKNNPKYLFINSGNANACTGKTGMRNTIECTMLLAKKLNCQKEKILMFSTGIIGRQLPMKLISKKIINHSFKFNSSWISASKSIMTTDAFNKYLNKTIMLGKKKISIKGMCKGAGMIEPDMATMLAFISIDLHLNKTLLSQLLKKAVDSSFNCISVDGDMSTNDSVAIIATGENKDLNLKNKPQMLSKIENELIQFCQSLAKMIVKDGEGATKMITITIHQASKKSDAKRICYAIANSNLFKTAMFGADPNWGRIIAKLGSLDNIDYDAGKVILKINQILVFEKGIPAKNSNLNKLNASMKQKEIAIDLYLRNGKAIHSIMTSDLTKKYIHINSTYTT